MKHANSEHVLGVRAGVFEFATDATTQFVARELGTIIVRVLDGTLNLRPDTEHSGNGLYHKYDENTNGFKEEPIGLDEIPLSVNDWFCVNNMRHCLYTSADQTALISVTVVQPEPEDVGDEGCRPCPTYPL